MFLNVQKLEAPLNLTDMVYSSIKKSIMNLDWSDIASDARFDERTVAARLGVSRTPLREAVKQLVAEGFLRVVPRRGLYVVRKSKSDMVEILLVRAALEGLAAGLAAKWATRDDIRKMRSLFSPFHGTRKKDAKEIFWKYSEANIQFHELIIQLSRCRKLIEVASALVDHVRWIRSWSIYNASFQQRFSRIHKEHLEIIRAIEKGDPDLAEKRVRLHIQGLATHLEQIDLPA